MSSRRKRAYPYKQFSLELMRNLGYIAEDCERVKFMFGKKDERGSPLVNPNSGIPPMRRVDLFGVADLSAINGQEMILVQATGAHGFAEHRAKIQEAPALPVLLAIPGIDVELHAWMKKGRFWACRCFRFGRDSGPGRWIDKKGVPFVDENE